MRIALRTGGGRGVYELAGTQGQYGVSDLFEREFIYEFTPELKISGRARAAVRQGKPRIKLDNTRNTTHFYRILTGLLLLPKAKREFRSTGNEEFLGFENYSVATIKIDIGDISSESVVIRPTDLILSNVGGYRKRLKFVDRLSRIMALWEKADSVDSELSVLLRAHKESVSSEDINHKLIEKSAQAISDYLQVVTDPIERIENLMSVVPLQFLDEEEESVLEELESFGLEDEKNPLAAKVENLRQWRKVAIRGSAALRFRFDVRESYNHTCLFTGQRLPKLESIASPGVDAAHILPWSSHGINTINNATGPLILG